MAKKSKRRQFDVPLVPDLSWYDAEVLIPTLLERAGVEVSGNLPSAFPVTFIGAPGPPRHIARERMEDARMAINEFLGAMRTQYGLNLAIQLPWNSQPEWHARGWRSLLSAAGFPVADNLVHKFCGYAGLSVVTDGIAILQTVETQFEDQREVAMAKLFLFLIGVSVRKHIVTETHPEDGYTVKIKKEEGDSRKRKLKLSVHGIAHDKNCNERNAIEIGSGLAQGLGCDIAVDLNKPPLNVQSVLIPVASVVATMLESALIPEEPPLEEAASVEEPVVLPLPITADSGADDTGDADQAGETETRPA